MATDTNGPIIFKTEDSLWQMLSDRTKRWDFRKWDITDERIYRLGQGRTYHGTMPTHENRWEPEVKQVTFENVSTGDMLHIEFKGIEFTPWAPGWAFLILGDMVDVDDLEVREHLPDTVCGNEWCPTCMSLR